MCACECVCKHHVHVLVCMYLCMCMYSCMCVHVPLCMCCLHVCTCMHAYVCVLRSSHFKGEETGAQRSEVTCLRSHCEFLTSPWTYDSGSSWGREHGWGTEIKGSWKVTSGWTYFSKGCFLSNFTKLGPMSGPTARSTVQPCWRCSW